MHQFLRSGAQMMSRHRWRKNNKVPLGLPCSDVHSWVVPWRVFSPSVGDDLDWSIRIFPCDRNVCSWTSKMIWLCNRNDRNVFFCQSRILMDWIIIWKNWSNLFLFWRQKIFSVVYLRGILVRSLNQNILSSHRIFRKHWWAASNCDTVANTCKSEKVYVRSDTPKTLHKKQMRNMQFFLIISCLPLHAFHL